MPAYLEFACECGRRLKARTEFAGTHAVCPACGRKVRIEAPRVAPTSASEPAATAAVSGQASRAEPEQIVDFLDPPQISPPRRQRTFSWRPMFEALLDPRSIQWMLTLGGALTVLGFIVWLVSLGVFRNSIVLAAALGFGTLAILAGGWGLVLKTRFRMAGQALTFLGCVLAPLNLWFYQAQDLLTLNDNLWLGGLACCALYAATVFVLRDPLFMYAVEVGITLTVLLLLAQLGRVTDATSLSLLFVGLGLVSIHAERAFSPREEDCFSRRRYGMPLFWSGQAQLGCGLCVLLAVQLSGWLFAGGLHFLGDSWTTAHLLESPLLAGGLWLAATYAYLYSDIVVRRNGIDTFLAAVSLILAEVTLVGSQFQTEGVIAILALTALAANVVHSVLSSPQEKFNRIVHPLALSLCALPVIMGLVLHVRATSVLLAALDWQRPAGWPFVVAMLIVALCNRASAYLSRRTAPRWSAVYFFFSAAGIIVAAAGLLRTLGLTLWITQAPLLMLIPLAYLLASHLWRGYSPERPLAWVAQTATAVILLHVLLASLQVIGSVIRPIQQEPTNLYLGFVFGEAALFYALAGWSRKRSSNVLLANLAACGALWQFLGYFGIAGPLSTILYALLGLAMLALGRSLGLQQIPLYNVDGEKRLELQGRGLAVFLSGNAILSVALVTAGLQGLSRLATAGSDWSTLTALALTIGTNLLAIPLVPAGSWRRFYQTSAVALAGLMFLTLNVLIDLNGWQKLEIFCVVVGIALLVAGNLGRFGESQRAAEEGVMVSLWLGCLLATCPLLFAVFYYRIRENSVSLPDELALLTVTIAMLVTGVSWRIKSTTLLGGGALTVYLVMLIVKLAYQPQIAIGIYLAAGGALVFTLGIALSIYREKLLALPEQIANREGIFQIISWR